jgi:arabinogalactan endo-1,4-beta-galactosidase
MRQPGSSMKSYALLGMMVALALTACARLQPFNPFHARLHPPLPSFILGADISWLPEQEAAGATFWDNGKQEDLFQILKNRHFNYIRLRVFVNPKATGGYAARKSEAFCDLEHLKAMAKRVRAAGMGFLLDFHFGDTWTSPGHQAKPLAWENYNFEQLQQAVHDHAHAVTLALKAQGTPPDMVEIGNEVSDGMLFPDGKRPNWGKFAAFVKAGIAGVKEVDPDILIVMHHHLGRDNARVRDWVDRLQANGVKFDVIGLSCYEQANEGDWKNNFNDLAQRYPDKRILAAEYSAHAREVNDLIHAVPNRRAMGTFIWEPTLHRAAFFNHNGVFPPENSKTNNGGRQMGGRYETNDRIKLYDALAKQYAIR